MGKSVPLPSVSVYFPTTLLFATPMVTVWIGIFVFVVQDILDLSVSLLLAFLHYSTIPVFAVEEDNVPLLILAIALLEGILEPIAKFHCVMELFPMNHLFVLQREAA